MNFILSLSQWGTARIADSISVRRLATEFFSLAGSSFLSQGANLAVNLYAAHLLGPDEYGIWSVLYLAITYAPYLTIGVLNSMGLEIPLRRGRGEDTSDVTGAAWLMTLLAMAGATIIALVYSQMIMGSKYRNLIWLTVVFVCVYLAQSFMQIQLRANKKFFAWSAQQAVTGIATLVLVFIAINRYRLPGFMLGQSIAILIAILLLKRQSKLPLLRKQHFLLIPHLIKVGAPIAIVGAMFVFLYTADRWIVLTMLNVRDLGYYAFAVRIAGIWLVISGIIGDQLYPRMAETYGRSGSANSLKSLMAWQQTMTAAVLLPMGIILYVLADPAIRSYFPAYSASVPVLKIFLVGYLFLALSQAPGSVLNILGKQKPYLGIQCVSVALVWAVGVTAAKLGGNVKMISIASSSIFLLYSVFLRQTTINIMKRIDGRELN